jgi:hypothetical protein
VETSEIILLTGDSDKKKKKNDLSLPSSPFGNDHRLVKLLVDRKIEHEYENNKEEETKKKDSSNVIRLAGYSTRHPDQSRETFRAVVPHDLDCRLIPAYKELKEFYIIEHPKASICILDSNRKVIKVSREQGYLGDHVWLPERLHVKEPIYNASEVDIEELANEAKQDPNCIWVGQIQGLAPGRELLEAAHPKLFELCTHPTIEDSYKTAPSLVNNDPLTTTSSETFYRPWTRRPIEEGGSCGKWNCPLCKPVDYLVAKWKEAKKKNKKYLVLGQELDSPQARKADFLLDQIPKIKKLVTFTMTDAILHPEDYEVEEEDEEDNKAGSSTRTDSG